MGVEMSGKLLHLHIFGQIQFITVREITFVAVLVAGLQKYPNPCQFCPFPPGLVSRLTKISIPHIASFSLPPTHLCCLVLISMFYLFGEGANVH